MIALKRRCEKPPFWAIIYHPHPVPRVLFVYLFIHLFIHSFMLELGEGQKERDRKNLRRAPRPAWSQGLNLFCLMFNLPTTLCRKEEYLILRIRQFSFKRECVPNSRAVIYT